MVQVENEYGTHGNDTIYTTWLRDAMKAYLVDDVVLFTTDTILDAKKGKIDGAYGTVDFGADASDVEFFFSLRSEPRGPFVNSEYYVGWIDRWSQPHETRSTELAVNTLKNMLDLGASVNIFLFHGGTNFGFKSGANGLDNPVVPTSYDWDAPLSEAGDPTGKYFALRGLIGQYLPLPRGSLPTTAAKFELDSVHMYPSYSLADIIKAQSSEFTSQFPMTFEQLGVDGGYVIYRTTVNFQASDPSLLSIAGLRDRAHVILDGQLVGILSRYGEVSSMPLRARKGSDLFILVENQGRFCYGQQVVTDHTKGILGNVTLGSVVLTKWTHHYHLKLDGPVDHLRVRSEPFLSVPAVYGGAFMVPEGSNGLDTFLRLDGWGKGVAFVNGVNIGRYWPDEGPQVTLYLPHVWLRPNHVNYIYIFETDRSPCMLKSACVVSLTGTHVLNGTTPVNLL
ncbi:Beta-galactosidase [Halotydeus destructor]|nr:Beta-galactosidase [Halotydeus destructor]